MSPHTHTHVYIKPTLIPIYDHEFDFFADEATETCEVFMWMVIACSVLQNLFSTAENIYSSCELFSCFRNGADWALIMISNEKGPFHNAMPILDAWFKKLWMSGTSIYTFFIICWFIQHLFELKVDVLFESVHCSANSFLFPNSSRLKFSFL